MTPDKFTSRLKEDSKIRMVFDILKDQEWHCRECEYAHTGITQIAGGSGIQGLQRGTHSCPGLEIDSDNHLCRRCERTTRHDRWRGSFQPSLQAGAMPKSFVKKVISLLKSRDVVEDVERTPTQLTIDHKLPMLRWTKEIEKEQISYLSMDDSDIKRHFQLLKRSNGSVSHNLLKSRSCEKCFKTGQRGIPFGIKFWYQGSLKWEGDSKKDPNGCIGCGWYGWYDFDEWRKNLNKIISN